MMFRVASEFMKVFSFDTAVIDRANQRFPWQRLASLELN
jgi:hypothetical protein